MDLRVKRFASSSEFLEAAGDFLGEREAEHNLIYGICANLIADPGVPGPPPYFAAVSRAGEVAAAALMTPPWNLVLSCFEDPGVPHALAADLDATGIYVPGVMGTVKSAGAFAATWCSMHDLTSHRAAAERIYRLERVVPPVGVPGTMRVATVSDRELLIEWVEAFLAEALEGRSPDDASVLVDRSFQAATRTWYLWDDGRPVSVAASGGPTPRGIRIGPVYTPPDLRRRGYASAVTAAASQAELDRGRRFIFLFTDLANPTSNKIYRQIGYEPILDVDQLRFAAARVPQLPA
jgi:predicted GNAT family acetyltransferase